jgi:peroxiredoxin
MIKSYLFRLAFLTASAVLMLVPASAQSATKIGQPVPVFDVTSPAGQKITNQNYSNKVLLLAFSTDYCSACKKAVPSIGGLAGRYSKQGFHVLGLFSGFGLDNDDLKEYVKTYGVTYPMALYEQKFASEQFGMRSVPYFVLVNRKGLVAGSYYGSSETTLSQIEDQVKKLLVE